MADSADAGEKGLVSLFCGLVTTRSARVFFFLAASLSCTMFALVRFKVDYVKQVVDVESFRAHRPRNLRDFDKKVWYEVYWKDGDDTTLHGYYLAQILRLFASREEAALNNKRVPVPPRPLDDEEEPASTTSASEEEAPCAVDKPAQMAKKKEAQEAFRKRHLELLKDVQPPTESELVKALRTENKKLRAQIEMLQNALCSKIFDTEGFLMDLQAKNSGQQAAVPFRSKANSANRPVPAATTGALKTNGAAKPPTVTSMQRLETAARQPETAARQPETAARQPETAARQPEAAARQPEAAARQPEAAPRQPEAAPRQPEAAPRQPETAPRQPETAVLQPGTTLPTSTPTEGAAGGEDLELSPHPHTPLYEAVDNEVCLGHGVSIPEAAFGHLMARPKDSVFVREACVRIFSTAGLVGRSVTGAASNRTKKDPKPSVDPEKYAALSGKHSSIGFFKHYLRQRCTEEEAVTRHRSLGKIVAMKIADVMKRQGSK
ncbi:uncharacterized protein LOC144165874 [Haemaphysalis longicornis]